MRRSAIVREARRDITTGMARAWIFAFIFAVILAIVASADSISIRQLTREAHGFQESGASVIVLSAENRIDAEVCDGLSRTDGIRASGAIRLRDERITPALLPSAPIQIADVTSGFPAVLNAESYEGSGIILAREAAEPLGLTGAGVLASDSGDIDVAGIYDYPNDGRMGGYGYLALSPTVPEEPFDECWVDIFPQSEELTALLYASLLSADMADEKTPTMSQLNQSLGSSFDGRELFSMRLTRFMPLVACVAGVVLGFIAIRLRRLEFASNLHAGVSRADMRAIISLETATWVLFGLTMAFSVSALIIASDMYTERFVLFLMVGRVFFGGVLGVSIGTAISWHLTREEHLFRYFKER